MQILQVVWLRELYSIIHKNPSTASSKSVERSAHTKDMFRGREAGTSPFVCTHRTLVAGTAYASWCTLRGYWFISLL